MEEINSTHTNITRHTIISNIATLFTGSAIAQGLTALTFILTARILGPEQYGQYTASMTLAFFCSIVFNLGLNLWLLQEGGRHPSKIGNLIGSILLIKILLGLAYLMLMFMLASLINNSTLPANLVQLSAMTIWLHDLFATSLTAFKAVLRNKTTALLETALATLLLLFTVILMASNVRKAANYMQMRAAILFFGFLVALILVKVLLQSNASWTTVKFVLSKTPPYAASEFLSWMYMRLDIMIIALMLGNYALGLYAPAVGIIHSLYIIPLTISFVILPVMSNQFVRNIDQAWLNVKRVMIVFFLVGVGLFFMVLFGANLVVYILGKSYAGTQALLQILSINLLLHTINIGLSAILVSSNQQAKRTIIQIISVTTNAILNFLLIGSFGIKGVAVVYIFTEIMILIGYSIYVIRYHRRYYIHESIDFPTKVK